MPVSFSGLSYCSRERCEERRNVVVVARLTKHVLPLFVGKFYLWGSLWGNDGEMMEWGIDQGGFSSSSKRRAYNLTNVVRSSAAYFRPASEIPERCGNSPPTMRHVNEKDVYLK